MTEKKVIKMILMPIIYFIVHFSMTTKMNTKTYVCAQPSLAPFQQVADSSDGKYVISSRVICI
jgi:hypothetical protein